VLTRTALVEEVKSSFQKEPIVALLGPRQCGKTTLARMIAESTKQATFFDLENPRDIAKLDDAMYALESISGLVILDEIQIKPELFNILRVLVDRPQNQTNFLILGSASPQLIKGVSETLAGRARFIEMVALRLNEVKEENWKSLWLRGGFPRSFLAESEKDSYDWRNDYIRTFLERDIPQMGINIPSATLRRFWTMVAHIHGNVWKASELARSLGSSEPTVKKYIDILAGAFVVRVLPPWFENISKRQLKSPKIYIRDSGLFHTLLGLEDHNALYGHPKYGASWEGFVVEQLISKYGSENAYFWGSHGKAELDFMVIQNGKKYGFEIKITTSPTTSKSMHSAIESLKLESLTIIIPGKEQFGLSSKIKVLGIEKLMAVGKVI